MRIFINDVPVRIIKPNRLEKDSHFEIDIDSKSESLLPTRFIHNVIVRNVSLKKLGEILGILEAHPFSKMNSLTILLDSNKSVRTCLKSYFTIIKAAGGIVRKGKKILMIFRLRKWDLPKGKVEPDESFLEAALREVEEECNVEVKLERKICTSYHTYTLAGKEILKKTVWFSMDLIDDSKMAPATGENIEELRWMNHKELLHSLHDTYRSLSYIMQKYFKKMGQIE